MENFNPRTFAKDVLNWRCGRKRKKWKEKSAQKYAMKKCAAQVYLRPLGKPTRNFFWVATYLALTLSSFVSPCLSLSVVLSKYIYLGCRPFLTSWLGQWLCPRRLYKSPIIRAVETRWKRRKLHQLLKQALEAWRTTGKWATKCSGIKDYLLHIYTNTDTHTHTYAPVHAFKLLFRHASSKRNWVKAKVCCCNFTCGFD